MTGSLSGLLVSDNHYFTGVSDWEAISYSELSVLVGETLTLWFHSIGNSGSDAHIDQVSLLYETSLVPEPTTVLLFGTSIAGLAGTRLRRKKK